MNFGAALGRIAIMAALLVPVAGPQSPAEAGSGLDSRADVTLALNVDSQIIFPDELRSPETSEEAP